MDKIPQPNTAASPRSNRHLKKRLLVPVTLSLGLAALFGLQANNIYSGSRFQAVPINANEILGKCRQLKLPAGPPSNFYERTASDRFESGTPPTLIKNATIWTGRVSGYEVIKGDILIDKGIIQAIGDIEPSDLNVFSELVTVDAGEAWVTPG